MKFKYKVEIVIDEEKVINDDIYEPSEMYEFIRNMFRRFDLPEIKTDKPYHLIFTDKGKCNFKFFVQKRHFFQFLLTICLYLIK